MCVCVCVCATVALIDTSGHPNDLNVSLQVRTGDRINVISDGWAARKRRITVIVNSEVCTDTDASLQVLCSTHLWIYVTKLMLAKKCKYFSDSVYWEEPWINLLRLPCWIPVQHPFLRSLHSVDCDTVQGCFKVPALLSEYTPVDLVKCTKWAQHHLEYCSRFWH